MSYRSIKRVLGETNLERKCRVLFGICLALLIGGAFYWVDRIAEGLVNEAHEQYRENMRLKGRDLVDMSMVKFHFERLTTTPEFREIIKEFTQTIEHQDYKYRILALEEDAIPHDNPYRQGRLDQWERKALEELKRDMMQQLKDRAQTESNDDSQVAQRADLNSEDSPNENEVVKQMLAPVFRERPMANDGEYYYYQPVYYQRSCFRCHLEVRDVGALPAADVAAFDDELPPFRVVKVVVPYKEPQTAINWIRAILMTAGLITFFVAMVALYVIVRYVIVKPLKHLRDVSDDVAQGKSEVRAELHTGDEFEELAMSFNRMLRHLTDAQGELRQVNIDLDAKVDQLAQLNMRLYEMNRLKSDFLANMSHELRTPLNSIIGFSEVLRGIDSLSDKQKRYAENIQKSGRLLLEMINDILDLAKLEAGKMDVRLSEFDLAQFVQAHCDMVRSLTEDKNINLEVDVQRGLPPMYQDRVKIQQILTNLLSNAIKFTPEGGRIMVSARKDDRDRLVMTVTDTGVGIAEEDREIIFEKFRQGAVVLGDDNFTREYSGTGLGLSIVKELCKLLGGEVTFESEVGKGSTFKIVLPWTLHARSPREAKLASKLDELTTPPRADFEPSRKSPQPHAGPSVPAVSPAVSSSQVE